MTDLSWYDLVALADGRQPSYRPVGFIIDSPWIPEWYGISKIDYYTSDELWLKANLRAISRFPGVWFLPGFWSEYGMCTEPSAYGSRLIFAEDNMPYAEKVIKDIIDIDDLTFPDVRTDGLLPFMINRLKVNHNSIRKAGHEIRFAISRGPFNIASFLMGTTEFMTALALEPERSHKLLSGITDFVCDWISWQKDCFPTIEGVFILDDIIGFVGDADFREYVVPLFRRIFGCTGSKIRFLHNDAEGLITAGYLKDMGVNMFNFSFLHSTARIRELAGPGIVLVGNLPPRDILAAGTPGQVTEGVNAMMKETHRHESILWSAGGGMPPGVKDENIDAFIDAVNNF